MYKHDHEAQATEGTLKPIQRHLRVHEVAALTGYATATLRRKIAQGEIESVKIGRIRVIPESAVRRLLLGTADDLSLRS